MENCITVGLNSKSFPNAVVQTIKGLISMLGTHQDPLYKIVLV